jgi:hypothetical protein
MSVVQPSRVLPGPYLLQIAATDGEGGILDASFNEGLRGLAIYVTFGENVSAGAVQLETAPTADYAGTWAPLGEPISASPGQSEHPLEGPLGFVRARISTPIEGDVVDVAAFGIY